MKTEDRIIDIALELQSISRNGLTYVKDRFDQERYEIISNIAAELLEIRIGIEKKTILEIFKEQKGYQTPKIETRGVVFYDEKILLVKENNKWALPGGWMDYNLTVSSNTIKEVEEESGMEVKTKRIIAVQNRNLHNYPRTIFEVIKIFVECELLSGEFKSNNETSDARFFAREDIGLLELDIDKTTVEQLQMCFDVRVCEQAQVIYD